jgi:hypothetical protein
MINPITLVGMSKNVLTYNKKLIEKTLILANLRG